MSEIALPPGAADMSLPPAPSLIPVPGALVVPGARPVSAPAPIGDRFLATYYSTTDPTWCELACNACGQRTSFANPIPERVRWFTRCHRCGPPGSRWVEGGNWDAAAQHAVTLGWYADLIEAEPNDTYLDDRAYAAASRLLTALETSVRAVEAQRAARRAGGARRGPAHLAGGRR